jgi:hypothetical protein
MAKKDTKDLAEFLEPFDDHIVEIAFWLRDFIWGLFPECNEMIYDNYNAVAVGWAPTLTLFDIFCSIAVYNNKNVHFGFYWGSKLADPQKLLIGKGKQYRYIRVETKDHFPAAYVKELLAEAHMNSLAGMKGDPSIKGQTVVKSISPKKKRPVKK